MNAIKWHGGKSYLAKKIIELMPCRAKNPQNPDANDLGWLHYVEPYAGGLAVLLANNPEGISEVVADAHGELCNFWAVLADTNDFAEMARILEATPFCGREWELAGSEWWSIESRATRAARFFIRCRQSMSGRMESFAPLSRNRTRCGMNEQVSAWLNAVAGLPLVHERLKRVAILNRPAMEVIRQQDGPRTMFYLDPPYLHATRATTGEYKHEMSADDHANLLDVLGSIKGRFLLSGYPSQMYADAEARYSWSRVDFELPNNSSSAKTKERKTERVWMNF